jgi:hypothetical protein
VGVGPDVLLLGFLLPAGLLLDLPDLHGRGLSLHTLLPLRTWSGMCLTLEGPGVTPGGHLWIG